MLKKAFAAGAALIFLAAPAGAREGKDDTIRFDPTVKLVWGDHHCTGFNIGAYIVSAGHCADKLDQVVEVHSTTGALITTARPVLVDNVDDISIWKASRSDAINTLSVECTPTHLGQEITLHGWPLGLGYVETWGHIIGQTRDFDPNWRKVLFTEAIIDHGDSGGPVLDAVTRRVVGIIVGGYHPFQTTWYVLVPATSLCSLLDL